MMMMRIKWPKVKTLHQKIFFSGPMLDRAINVRYKFFRSSRIKYTSRLLRNVRFPLISEQDLVKKVLTSSYVSEIAELCEIVQNALRYHRYPLKRIGVAPIRSKQKVLALTPSRLSI